jgi:hypothetical protein
MVLATTWRQRHGSSPRRLGHPPPRSSTVSSPARSRRRRRTISTGSSTTSTAEPLASPSCCPPRVTLRATHAASTPEVAGDYPPQVIMAAELKRVRILARYAARADCGAERMEDGLVCVYATSVKHIHPLARMMLAAQAELTRTCTASRCPRVQGFLGLRRP